MAMKLTHTKLLDDIKPSLEAISVLKFPAKVPMSFHLDIAKNLDKIETKVAKPFWDTRKKVLESLADKDENGKAITEVHEVTKASEYKLSEENRIVWNEKLEELQQEKIEIDLKKISQKNLEGIEGMKPAYIKGILMILKT